MTTTSNEWFSVRFWPRVELDGPVPEARPELGPCWLWLPTRESGDYGYVWRGGKLRRVHIVAWEAERGPVPEGLELDHLCRVRPCLRPSHMEAVTHRENVLRGDAPSARLARSTHCKWGHPFDAANTYITPAGHRQCRPCRARRERERRQQQRKAS